MAWRDGLAGRYGWLPLTTSEALLWLGAAGLVVAAYVRRRQQKEVHLAEMEAQEAAEEAAMRAALEAELAQQRQLLPPPLPAPAERAELTEPSDVAEPSDAAAPEWHEPSSPSGPEFEEDEEAAPRPSKPTVH
jgi:hypothetical protein